MTLRLSVVNTLNEKDCEKRATHCFYDVLFLIFLLQPASLKANRTQIRPSKRSKAAGIGKIRRFKEAERAGVRTIWGFGTAMARVKTWKLDMKKGPPNSPEPVEDQKTSELGEALADWDIAGKGAAS